MTPTAIVLGSLTVPGRPEHVSRARSFVALLAGPGLADTAALLTSEVVTNAVLHSASARPGGTVTIVVIDVPEGLLVEVVDDGSPADVPEVRGDRYAAQGHGLFLVEQLATAWGYLRDGAGTTVWFRLEAVSADGHGGSGGQDRSGGPGGPSGGSRRTPSGQQAGKEFMSQDEVWRRPGTQPRPARGPGSATSAGPGTGLRVVYPVFRAVVALSRPGPRRPG